LPLLFLAALIAIPIIEITVFIEIGGEIGAFNTIILTILTAVAGMILLRIQGLSILTQAQARIQKGETPAKEILNGLLLAIAGLFLLIPGFVTDSIGFLLFLPPIRSFLALWLGKRFILSARPGYDGSYSSGSSTVIDGEFHVVDEEDDKKSEDITKIGTKNNPNPDSPWSKDN
jgi:UPF0716 protein FxsA